MLCKTIAFCGAARRMTVIFHRSPHAEMSLRPLGYVLLLHGCVRQCVLEHGHFLNIDISQGSVATGLRCDGIFKYKFVANLPPSLSVKKF